MLRRLIQGIEQALGPTVLAEASFLVYWGGMILVLLAVLAPFYRRWMESSARRIGLTRHWLMTCRACGRQTIITNTRCGYCEEDLGISAPLAQWTGATRKPVGANTQEWRWRVHLLGNILFVVLSFWFVTSLDTVTPEGQLHKLFVGFAILSWVSMGRFTAMALRLDQGGAANRVRAGVLALSAAGTMGISLILAAEASPVPETVLARFSTDGDSVLIEDKQLALRGRKVGFEYLQLDHELFGYQGVIALAFVGRERLPVSDWPLKGVLVTHLREHADAYAARGVTVRLRTDHVRVRPAHTYQVVKRRGQVKIRKMAAGGPTTAGM